MRRFSRRFGRSRPLLKSLLFGPFFGHLGRNSRHHRRRFRRLFGENEILEVLLRARLLRRLRLEHHHRRAHRHLLFDGPGERPGLSRRVRPGRCDRGTRPGQPDGDPDARKGHDGQFVVNYHGRFRRDVHVALLHYLPERNLSVLRTAAAAEKASSLKEAISSSSAAA